MEKQRLQKLAGIKEIEVLDPSKAIRKQDVLDYFFGEEAFGILSDLTNQYGSLEKIIEEYGTLEEYLEEWRYEERQKEIIPYMKAYYKLFQPNEILVIVFGGEGGFKIQNGTLYKNIEVEYIGEGYYYAYFNNY